MFGCTANCNYTKKGCSKDIMELSLDSTDGIKTFSVWIIHLMSRANVAAEECNCTALRQSFDT